MPSYPNKNFNFVHVSVSESTVSVCALEISITHTLAQDNILSCWYVQV